MGSDGQDNAKKKLIFIAEDDSDQIATLRMMFDNAGYSVVTESDADRVLRGIVEVDPDIVLLDVMLPSRESRDGFQICQEIRAHPKLKETPVILVSAIAAGAASQRDKVRDQVGAQDFFLKPYDPTKLVERVRELIR